MEYETHVKITCFSFKIEFFLIYQKQKLLVIFLYTYFIKNEQNCLLSKKKKILFGRFTFNFDFWSHLFFKNFIFVIFNTTDNKNNKNI